MCVCVCVNAENLVKLRSCELSELLSAQSYMGHVYYLHLQGKVQGTLQKRGHTECGLKDEEECCK